MLLLVWVLALVPVLLVLMSLGPRVTSTLLAPRERVASSGLQRQGHKGVATLAVHWAAVSGWGIVYCHMSLPNKALHCWTAVYVVLQFPVGQATLVPCRPSHTLGQFIWQFEGCISAYGSGAYLFATCRVTCITCPFWRHVIQPSQAVTGLFSPAQC